MTTNAMKAKRVLRAKTPKFSRHTPHRKARLGTRWKKPRGLHNKQKDNKTGSAPKVSDGYRTPQSVRGLHISGMKMITVSHVKQLQGLDVKTQAVVVASVGAKRQIEILEACAQQKIKVLNHKPNRVEALRKTHTDRKAASEAARAERQKKVSKSEKKPIEEKLTEEEKKEQQDKVKEEILTGKDQ